MISDLLSGAVNRRASVRSRRSVTRTDDIMSPLRRTNMSAMAGDEWLYPMSGTSDSEGRPRLSEATVTSNDGVYFFNGIPEGEYTLIFTLGNNMESVPEVPVVAGSTTVESQQFDWKIMFADTIVVSAASRRTERVVEAPAAGESVFTFAPDSKAAREYATLADEITARLRTEAPVFVGT